MSSPLELLPAHLEWRQRRDAISAIYARFYAPIAVAITVLAFFPLFRELVTIDDLTVTVSSTDPLEVFSGDLAVSTTLTLILMGALAVLLAAATFRARRVWLPLGIAALGALLLLMLLGRPGFGYGRPGLTAAGVAGLVIAAWTALLGLVHAVHLHPLDRVPYDEPDEADDED